MAAVLGCFMVFLGATALNAAGAPGIAGGLVVVGLISTRGRLALRFALPLLAVAVLSFVMLTWWSAATPPIGALALTLGTLAVWADPLRS